MNESRSIRFKANVDGHEITGPVLNPGNWFGKVWLIQVNIANALQPIYAVEADTESDALDILANDKQYGHWLDLSEEEHADRERVGDPVWRAGNNDRPIDILCVNVSPSPKGLIYFAEWSPLFWQKTDAIDSTIEEHDREVVI